MLEVWPVCSPHARARIIRRDVSAARTMPGIAAVLLAEDVPGLNDVGAVRHDEILLADKETFYHGQIIALVVGETPELCRAAAAKVVVEYEPLPPILTIEEAIAANSFHADALHIRRGDVAAALKNAPLTFDGELSFGGQDHFYLESNAAWAECGEDGTDIRQFLDAASVRECSTSSPTCWRCRCTAWLLNARAWAAGSAAKKPRRR